MRADSAAACTYMAYSPQLERSGAPNPCANASLETIEPLQRTVTGQDLLRQEAAPQQGHRRRHKVADGTPLAAARHWLSCADLSGGSSPLARSGATWSLLSAEARLTTFMRQGFALEAWTKTSQVLQRAMPPTPRLPGVPARALCLAYGNTSRMGKERYG